MGQWKSTKYRKVDLYTNIALMTINPNGLSALVKQTFANHSEDTSKRKNINK